VTDVLVIGAGIIGAACAWRLSQAGLSVRVLDRAAPGSQASQAALGVRAYRLEPDGLHPGEALRLGGIPRKLFLPLGRVSC